MLLALTALVVVVAALLSPAFGQGSTATFILQYLPILRRPSRSAGARDPVRRAIDLSIGSTRSRPDWPSRRSPRAAGRAGRLRHGLGPWRALGAANGWLVAVLGVPSLMATLATMFLYGGLAVALTGGKPIGGLPDAFGWLAQGRTFGVPNHVCAVLVLWSSRPMSD